MGEWAAILQQDPDPSVITDARIRSRISATGYPWLVRHEASGVDFVLIPPGEYQAGAKPGEVYAEADEKPAHRIVIDQPFYMARTEVTVRQYWAYFGKIVRHDDEAHDEAFDEAYDDPQVEDEALDDGALPLVMVRWVDADAYCRSLGEGFRLPEEWEWEYAARATSTTRFPWGDGWDDAQGNAFSYFGRFRTTAPVGSFPPNGFGLRDMIGNVAEWCATVYAADAYANTKDGVPSPPDSTSAGPRVQRGGSWFLDARYCRSANRGWLDPSIALDDVGFRPMRTLP